MARRCDFEMGRGQSFDRWWWWWVVVSRAVVQYTCTCTSPTVRTCTDPVIGQRLARSLDLGLWLSLVALPFPGQEARSCSDVE